ncbi:MAG: ABC transporter ATP-binding protein [Deltaproteobacteria bacterium]|jgi:ABC-type bacteriocin/lantibiotic exporter with double-glycine peptidase domain|nr:ABC transporter ATP-binding protein [Deltaproteobacteria bacterium]
MDLPPSFMRRVAEATGTPFEPSASARADEAPPSDVWQLALEAECAAHGMHARRVLWSPKEAFGAAAPGAALVTARSGPGGPEWLAIVGRRERRVLTVQGDGSTRWLTLDGLMEWLAVDGAVHLPLSWMSVEGRFPSAMRLGPRAGDAHAGASPFSRLLDMLQPDQTDLWAIVLFAALIGGLTLATPIAVQQLVNSIAFGGLIQPVIVLALLLFAVLAFSAVLSAVQAFVAELIQRRIFVRVVIDVAERLPRVQTQAFDLHHGPELVNRVFDVVTIQKVGSALLLEGTAVLLQTIVGLIVLSFYHPLMLGFSGLLIIGIVVVLAMGRGAVDTAVEESRAKYDVVGWLEELARHASIFREADQRDFARDRADALAAAYVGARRNHYRIVLRQLCGALALQVIASSVLLALGGMLVVQGQLTLGQLVASELIITVIVAAVAKFGKQLENYYDLLAAMDKLGTLLDLPLERERGDKLESEARPATLELGGLSFGYGSTKIFEDFELRINAGERLAVEGAMGSGKSALLDLLFGLREPQAGFIAIDGHDYRDLRLESLRSRAALVREPEIFSGTIRDNIRVGRLEFGNEEILGALDAVGLLEAVRAMPDGIETRLSTDGRPLSQVQVDRLMLARALVNRPQLLLVDRALDNLDDDARRRICDLLFDDAAPWTLVVVSGREDVLARCTRRLRLGSPEVWREDAEAPQSKEDRIEARNASPDRYREATR